MTKTQLNNICTLAMASRKASEYLGKMDGRGYTHITPEASVAAEDAYAALMSAIFELTKDPEHSSEWIEEPGK